MAALKIPLHSLVLSLSSSWNIGLCSILHSPSCISFGGFCFGCFLFLGLCFFTSFLCLLSNWLWLRSYLGAPLGSLFPIPSCLHSLGLFFWWHLQLRPGLGFCLGNSFRLSCRRFFRSRICSSCCFSFFFICRLILNRYNSFLFNFGGFFQL